MTKKIKEDNVLDVLDMKRALVLKDNIDIDERIIYLNGYINSKTTSKFIRALNFLEGVGEGPITVMINSGGGSVYDGFSIVDRIQNSFNDITTIATGFVASMAIPILCSGKVRKATKNASFMFHGISYNLPLERLPAAEIEGKQAKELNKKICRFMTEHTKKNYSYWSRQGKYVDFYFDSEKALDIGVIDEIL